MQSSTLPWRSMCSIRSLHFVFVLCVRAFRSAAVAIATATTAARVAGGVLSGICFALSVGGNASLVLAQPLAIDKILVVVNHEPITLSEYQARHQREALQESLNIAPFAGDIEPRLLELMIDERIQTQVAKRRNIRITSAEVDDAINYIAAQNGSTSEQLFALLKQSGITSAQFRASIRQQQLLRRLLEIAVHANVVVTKQEIEDYLVRHPHLVSADLTYEISHLLISLQGKSSREAQAEYENLSHLRQGALEGQSFEKLVHDFSDNPNREQGGYLGWRTPEQLPELFVQTLRPLENGQLSEIITSHNALHLLKLHNKRGKKLVEQQHLRHILLRPGSAATADLNEQQIAQLAAQLYQRLVDGEDFAQLANAYSADQISRAQGGDLGWVTSTAFPLPFEQAARALQDGAFSKPVRTQSGLHIIQSIARRNYDNSHDLAMRRARQNIFRRKANELYDNWFGPLRETAYIEYVSVTPG